MIYKSMPLVIAAAILAALGLPHPLDRSFAFVQYWILLALLPYWLFFIWRTRGDGGSTPEEKPPEKSAG